MLPKCNVSLMFECNLHLEQRTNITLIPIRHLLELQIHLLWLIKPPRDLLNLVSHDHKMCTVTISRLKHFVFFSHSLA